MMNAPGVEIAINDLWLMMAGPNCLVLAVVYGVFKTYKNGMRPFFSLPLSPVNGESGVQRVQVMMYKLEQDQSALLCFPYFDPTVIQHPAQFICRFPQKMWFVDYTSNCVHLDCKFHLYVSQWNQYCPVHWQKMKLGKVQN